MMLLIDPTSSQPPYEQLHTQIAAMIQSGELPAESRLPTVRRLAGDLGIAPGTVARAYRELELLGLLETRGRAGTFITNQDTNPSAQAAADAYVEQIRALGLPISSALSFVEQAVANSR